MRSTRSLAALALAAALCLLAFAAPAAADYFRPDARYDSSVPEPAAILNFAIGDRPARHHEIMRYCEALAEASPRARLVRYATTHEGRDLVYLVIGSEANLERLESIQADVHALADPRRSLDRGALDELLRRTPAVAYCAYSIHGDELSGADAALRVAYELVAGEDTATRTLRENLVVLVDPTENPDGRDRVLSMYDTYKGAEPNPDPESLAHGGMWPWGRANHYLFDLNRDWFALVHPESRGRAAILSGWRPQLVIDAHEMGSSNTYLFSPPRDPFNPNWPSGTLEWWDRFAADQARAFDRHGWSYYTRAWNEEFFPGYGSALAIYQGAVGILYEQARTSGHVVRKPSGKVAEFREAIAHQFESTLANLGTAAANRVELLRWYRGARAEAVARGREGAVRAFYFAPRPDAARAERLAERLSLLGVEVERLHRGGALKGARGFYRDGAADAPLPAGSFRVRLDQPDGLLAKAILEPHTLMPDSSLAEERYRIERKQGSRIYDTTAWSLLLASGLDCWWSGGLDKLDWRPSDEPFPPRPPARPGPAAYGWLFDGKPDAAPVLAAKLAAAGLKIRVGTKPFTLGGRKYPRGSFLLRVEDNPAGAPGLIEQLGDAAGVPVHPVATARILEGPDLGGEDWRLLPEPRIAIAAGPPLNFTSVGAAWHLLDRECGLRVSLLDVSNLARIDLARYNVLVLPHVWGGGYGRALGDGGLAALREWVDDGGTLVALAGAAEFLADSTSGFSQVRPRRQVLSDFPPPAFGIGAEAVASLERMQASGLGPDGLAVETEGVYVGTSRAAAIGIPGPGAPVLGPGLWAMFGEAGEAQRKRGSLLADAGGDREEAPERAAPASGAEKERAEAKADARLRRFLPSGAILRVDLDPTHWLCFGAGDRVPALTGRRDALIARDPVDTAGRFAAPGNLHLGGLVWPEAVGRISQTAYLTREGKGRGQAILFASDPNFRGYFWGTERLFLNAVVLGPGMGASRRIGW